MPLMTLRTLVGAGGAALALSAAAVPALGAAILCPRELWAWLVPAAGLPALAAAWLARRAALRLLDRAEAAQRVEHLRFDTAINNISQGLCFFDGQQRLIVSNRRYGELYRLTPEQVKPGTTLRQVVERRVAAGTVPAMSGDDYIRWRETIAVSNRVSDTVTELQDGRTFAIHHEPMPDGGWVATHEDITERRHALAQIEHMARNDALTGLPNRVQFRDRLAGLLQQARPQAPVAVLFIDLDRFKTVNDTLGHPAGDALLVAAAARLQRCLRQGDLVARLGGDEFAIVQSGAPQPDAAQALAKRLVRAFDDCFTIETHAVQVGASIGIALAPGDGEKPDELLKNADLALYDAKAAGRGTFRCFREGLGEQARARQALEADLRLAIEHGQLQLHYQPIVDIASGRIVCAEALLRWHHPLRGQVMPDQFIALAEETGQIDALGAWVLKEAFACAATWPPHVAISVNLSPSQIAGGRLPDTVAAALAATGLAPQRVELEITETVRLAEDSHNLAQLRELQALGLGISLDDFGVGYSSLSYLRSFPFRRIKIDRSFVRDVVGSAEAVAIVRAIVALGSSLGITITAEGVEQAEQLALLRTLGCDAAQGYHLGRPQGAAALAELLRADVGPRLHGVRASL